jgi:hypothetical protein
MLIGAFKIHIYFSIMLTMVRAVQKYKEWIRLRKGVAVAKDGEQNPQQFCLISFRVFV